MRVIATLLLSAAFGFTAWAGEEGTCSQTKAVAQCATGELEVSNSCLHMCPVAREATTLGRLIVMEIPVALVDRGELEA